MCPLRLDSPFANFTQLVMEATENGNMNVCMTQPHVCTDCSAHTFPFPFPSPSPSPSPLHRLASPVFQQDCLNHIYGVRYTQPLSLRWRVLLWCVVLSFAPRCWLVNDRYRSLPFKPLSSWCVRPSLFFSFFFFFFFVLQRALWIDFVEPLFSFSSQYLFCFFLGFFFGFFSKVNQSVKSRAQALFRPPPSTLWSYWHPSTVSSRHIYIWWSLIFCALHQKTWYLIGASIFRILRCFFVLIDVSGNLFLFREDDARFPMTIETRYISARRSRFCSPLHSRYRHTRIAVFLLLRKKKNPSFSATYSSFRTLSSWLIILIYCAISPPLANSCSIRQLICNWHSCNPHAKMHAMCIYVLSCSTCGG
jgi:hypothetical protein